LRKFLFAACATRGVTVEINPNPWRLDLDWRWHERALERGCMMSINPDAHSTDQIDHTHWGSGVGAQGRGVPKERKASSCGTANVNGLESTLVVVTPRYRDVHVDRARS
jgi:DNA polymerase (family X)